MNETLVIGMPEGAVDQASWLIVDAEGRATTGVSEGNLADAAPLTAERLVTVVLHDTRITRTSSDLPVRGAKLAKALPFALEEQFAEDVELLHFAAGEADEDGQMPVAAIRRDIFEGYLDALSAAGIQPQRIFGVHDGLPALAGFTQLLVDQEMTLLRGISGDVTGMQGLRPFDVLQAWSATQSGDEASEDEDEHDLGANIRVYCDARSHAHFAKDWEQMRVDYPNVDIKLLDDGSLPFLANTLINQPGINWLQGSYSIKTSTLNRFRPWATAAAMLLAAFVITTFGQLLEYRQYRQQAAQLDQEISSILTSVTGNSGDVSNAEAQLSALLGRRSKAANTKGADPADNNPQFLPTLTVLAKAIDSNSKTSIDAISYRNGVFDIRLTTQDANSLEALRAKISDERDLEASIQRTQQTDDGVKSFLQIKTSGA